eukprot:g1521.t1
MRREIIGGDSFHDRSSSFEKFTRPVTHECTILLQDELYKRSDYLFRYNPRHFALIELNPRKQTDKSRNGEKKMSSNFDEEESNVTRQHLVLVYYLNALSRAPSRSTTTSQSNNNSQQQQQQQQQSSPTQEKRVTNQRRRSRAASEPGTSSTFSISPFRKKSNSKGGKSQLSNKETFSSTLSESLRHSLGWQASPRGFLHLDLLNFDVTVSDPDPKVITSKSLTVFVFTITCTPKKKKKKTATTTNHVTTNTVKATSKNSTDTKTKDTNVNGDPNNTTATVEGRLRDRMLLGQRRLVTEKYVLASASLQSAREWIRVIRSHLAAQRKKLAKYYDRMMNGKPNGEYRKGDQGQQWEQKKKNQFNDRNRRDHNQNRGDEAEETFAGLFPPAATRYRSSSTTSLNFKSFDSFSSVEKESFTSYESSGGSNVPVNITTGIDDYDNEDKTKVINGDKKRNTQLDGTTSETLGSTAVHHGDEKKKKRRSKKKGKDRSSGGRGQRSSSHGNSRSPQHKRKPRSQKNDVAIFSNSVLSPRFYDPILTVLSNCEAPKRLKRPDQDPSCIASARLLLPKGLECVNTAELKMMVDEKAATSTPCCLSDEFTIRALPYLQEFVLARLRISLLHVNIYDADFSTTDICVAMTIEQPGYTKIVEEFERRSHSENMLFSTTTTTTTTTGSNSADDSHVSRTTNEQKTKMNDRDSTNRGISGTTTDSHPRNNSEKKKDSSLSNKSSNKDGFRTLVRSPRPASRAKSFGVSQTIPIKTISTTSLGAPKKKTTGGLRCDDVEGCTVFSRTLRGKSAADIGDGFSIDLCDVRDSELHIEVLNMRGTRGRKKLLGKLTLSMNDVIEHINVLIYKRELRKHRTAFGQTSFASSSAAAAKTSRGRRRGYGRGNKFTNDDARANAESDEVMASMASSTSSSFQSSLSSSSLFRDDRRSGSGIRKDFVNKNDMSTVLGENNSYEEEDDAYYETQHGSIFPIFKGTSTSQRNPSSLVGHVQLDFEFKEDVHSFISTLPLSLRVSPLSFTNLKEVLMRAIRMRRAITTLFQAYKSILAWDDPFFTITVWVTLTYTALFLNYEYILIVVPLFFIIILMYFYRRRRSREYEQMWIEDLESISRVQSTTSNSASTTASAGNGSSSITAASGDKDLGQTAKAAAVTFASSNESNASSYRSSPEAKGGENIVHSTGVLSSSSSHSPNRKAATITNSSSSPKSSGASSGSSGGSTSSYSSYSLFDSVLSRLESVKAVQNGIAHGADFLERIKNLFTWAHPHKTQAFLHFMFFGFIVCCLIPSRIVMCLVLAEKFTQHFRKAHRFGKMLHHFIYSIPNDVEMRMVFENISVFRKLFPSLTPRSTQDAFLRFSQAEQRGQELSTPKEKKKKKKHGGIKSRWGSSKNSNDSGKHEGRAVGGKEGSSKTTRGEEKSPLRRRRNNNMPLASWAGHIKRRGFMGNWRRRFVVLTSDGILHFWLNHEEFLSNRLPKLKIFIANVYDESDPELLSFFKTTKRAASIASNQTTTDSTSSASLSPSKKGNAKRDDLSGGRNRNSSADAKGLSSSSENSLGPVFAVQCFIAKSLTVLATDTPKERDVLLLSMRAKRDITYKSESETEENGIVDDLREILN